MARQGAACCGAARNRLHAGALHNATRLAVCRPHAFMLDALPSRFGTIWRIVMRNMALIMGLAALVGLSGCTNPYDPNQRTLGGAGIGAVGGALIGGLAGGGRGAAIGALTGAAVGGVAGAATTPQPPPPGYQPGYYPPAPPPPGYSQGNYPPPPPPGY